MSTFNSTCEFIDSSKGYVENFEDSRNFINIIYCVLFICSLFLTYWGNSFMKHVLAVIGFFPGFYLTYYILSIIGGNLIALGCDTIIVISCLIGITTAFVCKAFVSFAYTSLGFLVGSSIGYILYIFIFHNINIGTTYIYTNSFILTELVSGVTGAVIFWKTKKEQLIIFTSFVGSYYMIYYFDKLVMGNIDGPRFNLNIKDAKVHPVTLVIYIASYLIFAVSGYWVQDRRHHKRSVDKSTYSGVHDSILEA